MRIVFLRANPINPDPRVEKEAKALLEGGHSCLFVGWDRESNHETLKTFRSVGGYEVTTYLIGVKASFGQGAKNTKNVMAFEYQLYRWLVANRDRYDVIHSCDLDTGIAAKYAAKRTKKSLIYDIFDFYSDSRIMPNWLKSIVRRIEYSVIESSRATIICTEQRIIQIEEANYNEIIVIENTPEKVKLTNDSYIRNSFNDRIRLAYVGILTNDRYLDKLLDAVERYDNLYLEIGGFGPLSEMIANRADACDRIVFKGKLSYIEALECEKSADIMFGMYNPAIANNRLAAPNKYYESLMLGVPLITIQGTSVGEWVEKEQTGIALSPSFDSDDLYRAVTDLAEANADGTLSNRERQLYAERHSWEIMKERIKSLYDRIGSETSDGDDTIR